MGLIDFFKGAGEKIFGKSEEKKEAEKAQAVLEHLKKYQFDVENLEVSVDNETVTVRGQVKNALDRNRIVVAAGNIEGVSKVNDLLQVVAPEPVPEAVPEKEFYTVKPGDTLSKISKEVYGDAMKYNKIFEANRPMLSNPDLIYPGQVLVIPE
ncbi:MAG: peptidoglycan-binding protein LysM [Petrimonas sp.]|nr:peptidoglycan-binding protein LysM [Petrimonas sp.]